MRVWRSAICATNGAISYASGMSSNTFSFVSLTSELIGMRKKMRFLMSSIGHYIPKFPN